MKRNRFYLLLATAVAALGFTSCMEFDHPLDSLTIDQIALSDSVYHGNPEEINYRCLSEAG